MVRWAKFGDENTTFFHAAATERYRLNTITTLDTQDGRIVTNRGWPAVHLGESPLDPAPGSPLTYIYSSHIRPRWAKPLWAVTKPL
jgi:hypothetical protein